MADTNFPATPLNQINAEYNHKASEGNSIGDLAWYDSATPAVRKASAFTDAGTAASTQAAFAALFAGIFLSKQLSTDSTARGARVEIDTIREFACASATFVAGDFVTPTYSAGVLSDQQVTKTTNPALAIGRVVKDYASATTKVKVRLTSQLLNGPGLVRPNRVGTGTVAATGSTQADAAPVPEGFTLVTAADATKGVRLPAAVAGMAVELKNADAANAVLKIWPATGNAVNALAANAAFSIAAKTCVRLIAYDATTWYSLPLLPS